MNQSPTARTARELLGVDEHADSTAIRTEFLRQLPDHSFHPPTSTVTALTALDVVDGKTSDGQDPAFQRRLESTLEGDIEAFATQYWQLVPEQRRAAWDELNRQVQRFPRLRFRLKELEQGLAIVPPANVTGFIVADLVQMLTTTYPLKPTVRAERWAAYLRTLDNRSAFRVAVRQLQKEHPALVHLGASWLGLEQAADLPVLPKDLRPVEATSTYVAASSSGSSSRYAWLLIILVVGIIRFAIGVSEAERRPEPIRNPYFKPIEPPKFEFPKEYNFPNTTDARDRELINKYLRELEKNRLKNSEPTRLDPAPKKNDPSNPLPNGNK